MTLNYTISPVIKDGNLYLTKNGDLQTDIDIVTQVAVALTGYNCIFNNYLESKLIPYLDNKSLGTNARNTITNICTNAYQYLITQKLISNLIIKVRPQTISTVNIEISVIDNQGSNILLNWINP